MSWLYKFLLKAIDDNYCVNAGCTTCGSTEFRAALISNLKCYKNIPNVTKLLKLNYRKNIIAPVYKDLETNIQKKIVDEISQELLKLKKAQISRLDEISSNYPILRFLFIEFSNQSDYLFSLIVGSPAGNYLKTIVDHYNTHHR